MKNRTTTAVKRANPATFVADTIGELRKVVWLTRREIVYLTGLVVLVTVVVGLVLGLIDFGFSKVVDNLFLLGK